MKRFLLFIILLISCSLTPAALSVGAQSMSDAQVVDYIKERHNSGVSQTTIATELLEKGATREQLMRIKKKYENAQEEEDPVVSQVIDRSRKNNGENARVKDAVADDNDDSNEEDKIYGHDIFRKQLLSFEPNMSIAVPQNYILGPGDEVIVDVYGDSQRTDKMKIAPDGTVNLKYAGPVYVSGKTMSQATSTIQGRLQQYFSGSNIKVSIGQTRTITVNVMGEVEVPGSYTLSAFASVFHALYQAGGINDIGTLRNIKVCRGSRVVASVDVYDYIQNGILSGNIMLADNDVILVGPYENLISVKGWVKRPMRYETKNGESLRTVLDYAGSFKGGAYTGSVRVDRKKDAEQYVYTPGEDEFMQFLMVDGDVVTVGTTSEARYTNMASIKGAVFRPGKYEIGDAAQTVRGLVEQAGGLEEYALRTRAVLLRMKPDRTREAITVDLDGIMNGTTPDIALRSEDELTISSRKQKITAQYLQIDGEVYDPGQYPYAENLTVEDLVTMAGGLKESASLLNVEVSRRIVNPESDSDTQQRAEIFNIKLKDGLNIGDESGFKLKAYDQVYVRKSPEYSEQRSIWVRGEVLFEGKYVLENQEERLSDVVKRIGGFTKKASIRDARLKRHMNEEEMLRRDKLIKKSQTSNDSIDIEKLDLAETYFIGIDLNEAISHPGSSADLVLRDGDELVIPQFDNTVRINGEVLYPNAVTFVEGKPLSYYINQAGGYSKESEKRHTYIIYNNGQVSRAKHGKVQPGCEIIVPSKQHRDRSKALTTSLSVTTALATIAAILVTALK